MTVDQSSRDAWTSDRNEVITSFGFRLRIHPQVRGEKSSCHFRVRIGRCFGCPQGPPASRPELTIGRGRRTFSSPHPVESPTQPTRRLFSRWTFGDCDDQILGSGFPPFRASVTRKWSFYLLPSPPATRDLPGFGASGRPESRNRTVSQPDWQHRLRLAASLSRVRYPPGRGCAPPSRAAGPG